MPEYRRELIPDIRPDIRSCNNIDYKKWPHVSTTLSKKSPICLSSEIAKPNGLEYLRSIDIDSLVRGLSCKSSKCPEDCHCETNHNPTIQLGVELYNPKLVNINKEHNNDNIWYYNLDCHRECVENLFNNNTKNIYRKKLFK
jgi:hypothetical protein